MRIARLRALTRKRPAYLAGLLCNSEMDTNTKKGSGSLLDLFVKCGNERLFIGILFKCLENAAIQSITYIHPRENVNMGHTLVTRFKLSDYEQIRKLMERIGGEDSNKIPFGRDCDRIEADRSLPYHVTVAHWARQEDEECIRRLHALEVMPCEIWAYSHSVMHAEENSLILFLNIKPGEEFIKTAHAVDRLIPSHMTSFWHMTLAVSKDHAKIQRMADSMAESVNYPIPLHVTGLDLYHIWKPVRFVRSY